MLDRFESKIELRGDVKLPTYSGIRVQHMPIIMNDLESIPDFLYHWKDTFKELFNICEVKEGVGYITIDEKLVKKGDSQRRGGLHVDGVCCGEIGNGGWGGGGGGWACVGGGMYLSSSEVGCRAYRQEFKGCPGYEGECDHLRNQCKKENEILLEKNKVYWADGLCVHESIPMEKDTIRTMVRLSTPSNAPWFEGYTVNTKGVKPTGKILPKRKFMDM